MARTLYRNMWLWSLSSLSHEAEHSAHIRLGSELACMSETEASAREVMAVGRTSTWRAGNADWGSERHALKRELPSVRHPGLTTIRRNGRTSIRHPAQRTSCPRLRLDGHRSRLTYILSTDHQLSPFHPSFLPRRSRACGTYPSESLSGVARRHPAGRPYWHRTAQKYDVQPLHHNRLIKNIKIFKKK